MDKFSYETAHPPFEAYQGGEPYIFVSYAHKDAGTVWPEITRLHEAGYRIWYDEGISPGNDWPDEVAKALDGCAYFLVFVSPNAVASRNVRNEINFALNRDKPFLAIHLEPTTLPLGLELRMGDLQAVMRFRMPAERYWRKLLGTLPDTLALSPGKGKKAIVRSEENHSESEKDRIRGKKKTNSVIEIVQGGITWSGICKSVDAIVNSTDEQFSLTGCIDKAIHSSAGSNLYEECRKIGICPIGEARISKAYDISVQHIIHTTGPIYSESNEAEKVLSSCYLNCLEIAAKHGVASLAFPAISCGYGGFPAKKGSMIAIETVCRFLKKDMTIEKVLFVLFLDDTYNIYENYLLEMISRQYFSSSEDSSKIKNSINFKFFEGVWRTEIGGIYCPRIVDGRLLIPFCFSGNHKLHGYFYNCRIGGDKLFACYKLINKPYSGFAVFEVISDKKFVGGWWGRKSFPISLLTGNIKKIRQISGMKVFAFERQTGKKAPLWAEEYFGKKVIKKANILEDAPKLDYPIY